jgi:hypothetical protein
MVGLLLGGDCVNGVVSDACLHFRVSEADIRGRRRPEVAHGANGVDGAVLLPANDRVVADLLIRTASGNDVESDVIEVLADRAARA